MLKARVESELRAALKGRDLLRLSVLRMLSAAMHNKEIEKRTRSRVAADAALTDEEVSGVVRAEMKKRRDAAEAYRAGGRAEAAAGEDTEAEILSSFLPPELSDAELERIVAEGAKTVGVTSAQEFGKLMGWVMGRVKGQASGERVRNAVERKLKE